MRFLAAFCASLAFLSDSPAGADPARSMLARDISITESLRRVRLLQDSYAQYAQYGLWDEIGDLFAPEGRFIFDGQVGPAKTANGPRDIASFLRTRYGGGREGQVRGGLSAMMIDSPVINLAADGRTAKARFQTLIFHGHGGKARIEGGVLATDYMLEGSVWKIAAAHFYPQLEGPYEEGWTNWGGGDLPVPPYHFDLTNAGLPVQPALSSPRTAEALSALQKRVTLLNDEDRVRNLQAIYGYYADRRMWDDVVDLFAEDAAVEIGGQGIWRGKVGVRRWLDRIGEQGLRHGQLNDRVQFNVTVKVDPGGNEAHARGIELGMLGEADREQGWWEIATFHNRFIRQDGVWKLQEMRRFVQAKTDIFLGWGKSRISDPVPAGATAPDRPDAKASLADLVPAFLGRHPVTGRPVRAKGRAKLVATGPLTGRIAAGRDAPVDLDEIRRRLDRSRARDGAMNVGAAYGFYLDDSRPAGFAGLIAEKGFKVTPAIGYYIGRDRILAARAPSAEPEKRPGISYHWLVQPVFLISDDGRSATGHVRLFNFRTGKTVGKAGDLFGASFWGGMYYNQYVLENGHWRIWDLTIEEPFIRSLAWKDGLWAKVKDPPPGSAATAASNPFPPDIPIKALGKRAEGFRGGTGQTIEWPSIMPMWFEFTNPVSGRLPPLHQTDCTPCLVRPGLRLDRNGYQRPPDAPAANRSP